MSMLFRGFLIGVLSVGYLAAAQAQDIDNNPPGVAGGPGTNWENPPGWRGGPGASPDRWGDMTQQERQQWMEQRRQRWQAGTEITIPRVCEAARVQTGRILLVGVVGPAHLLIDGGSVGIGIIIRQG